MLTRLAPTPSGYLHQGNIFNFLLNWLLARSQGGKVLLRIDDLDAPRARPEYVQDVFETLDWLGMDWDLGPTGPDGLATNWSQNGRLSLYHDLLERLRHDGNLFACECSRKDLVGSRGFYNDSCLSKNLPLDSPDIPWRVKVDANAVIVFQDGWQNHIRLSVAAMMGSFVVRRRDGIPAYQIASLADDVHFGVTHVVRGLDLLSSTTAQLYLAQLLGLKTFAQTRFYHHPLLLDNGGQKLSKSKGSVSLRHWREEGTPASVLFENFCLWAGIMPSEKIQTATDLLKLGINFDSLFR